MTAWPGIRRIFRFDRGEVDRRVNDEMQFHFAMTVEHLLRRGLSLDQARLEAERLFGDVQATRQQMISIDQQRERRDRMAESLENALQDVGYTVRRLRHHPGFAIAIVAILGLGVGANATMFGVIDQMLFRPPAYLHDADATRQVYFASTSARGERIVEATSFPQYQDIAAFTTSFANVAAFFAPVLPVGTGASTEEMRVTGASATYWRLFDVRPALGRFFTPEEDRAGIGASVVVLGYEYWRNGFAGNTGVIGSQIRIGNRDYVAIGVAPAGFLGTSAIPSAAFIPLATLSDDQFGSGSHYSTNYFWRLFQVIVQRRAGVSESQAAADLTLAFSRSDRQMQGALRAGQRDGGGSRRRAFVAPVLHERGPNQGPEARVALWLAGVALLVLFIACANAGSMLLTRAIGRQRETAIRLALGISRQRLVLQALIEGLILAALGTMASVAILQFGGRILGANLLPEMAPANAFSDLRLVAGTLIIGLIAGSLTSLAPVLQASRPDMMAALKVRRSGGTVSHRRLRIGLLIVQGALSVILLVGAGLFVRSLRHASTLSLGYDADHVVYVTTEMRGVSLAGSAQELLLHRLGQVAGHTPGVAQVARGAGVPFLGGYTSELHVPGVDSLELARLGTFVLHAVDPEYFGVMRTRILLGHAITAADNVGSAKVIVVSQTMAHELWGRRDPLGQCVKVGDQSVPCSTVVGVSEDIQSTTLGNDPGLQYYIPLDQWDEGRDVGNGGLFIRLTGPAASQTEMIRRALQPLMPGESYIKVRSLGSLIDPRLRSWKLGATMFTAFGVLALLVATFGLYSIVAYDVAQRRYEFGVRAALGAQGRMLVWLVVRTALRPILIAITLGSMLAAIGARWLQPLLFGTSSHDPAVFVGVALAMVITACAASLIPALRAARVDPNSVLQGD